MCSSVLTIMNLYSAVHRNYEILREIQREAQKAYEENHSRQQFMKLFGRNYLED